MSRKRQIAKLYPHGRQDSELTTLSYEFGSEEHVEDHLHHEDQLVFASRGVMTVKTTDGMWIVPPMRAVWIPGGIVHSIQMSGIVSMRTLYFAEKFVRPFQKNCFVMNVSPLLRELIVHACGLSKLSMKLANEKRIIELILDQLDSRSTVSLQLPLPRDPRAKRLAELLISDPSNKALLDDLCEECGASKRTIERLFQDETQMTVGKWRQQLRMLQSIQMLASGDKVINVALEAGYSSPSAFISAFRKVLGTTPSHYCEIGTI